MIETSQFLKNQNVYKQKAPFKIIGSKLHPLMGKTVKPEFQSASNKCRATN